MKKLQAGITNQITKLIETKDSATFYGSGHVNVFATPSMIALMEKTAMESIEPFLKENETTVGFEVNIRHFKAVPIGDTVISTSILLQVEGKKLIFEVEVLHLGESVGKGSHVRYIVDKDLFNK